MSRLRIAIIAICGVVTLAGSFALRHDGKDEGLDSLAATASAAAILPVGTTTIPAAGDRRQPSSAAASPATEFLPVSDTTGLLRESLTIDQLLVEVNADSGAGITPVDREQIMTLLSSDPELRKVIAN